MLAMSDVNIEQFLPLFANTGVPVAFLVPTPTGYENPSWMQLLQFGSYY